MAEDRGPRPAAEPEAATAAPVVVKKHTSWSAAVKVKTVRETQTCQRPQLAAFHQLRRDRLRPPRFELLRPVQAAKLKGEVEFESAVRGLTSDIIERAMNASDMSDGAGSSAGSPSAAAAGAAAAGEEGIKTPRLKRRTLMFPFAPLSNRRDVFQSDPVAIRRNLDICRYIIKSRSSMHRPPSPPCTAAQLHSGQCNRSRRPRRRRFSCCGSFCAAAALTRCTCPSGRSENAFPDKLPGRMWPGFADAGGGSQTEFGIQGM